MVTGTKGSNASAAHAETPRARPRCRRMTSKKDDGQKRGKPLTDDASRVAPLHGGDREGLGDKGWAEVDADGVGGHPELQEYPRSGPEGLLNGPAPEIDPETGAPAEAER
jgi:hypothetical protein